ncbi:MAG: hypothetical protein ACTHZ1_00230 [Sphingobacterium sp.]
MDHELRFPIDALDIIHQCIPQRHPMLMVDSLLDYQPTRLKAALQIQNDNLFVKDGCLQETGLIEHMAQAIALHTGFSYYLRREHAPIGYIGSINNLDILSCPKVGNRIITRIQVIQEFSGVTLVEIECTENGRLIAKGKMKTVIANPIS